jgi:hypothetical protein
MQSSYISNFKTFGNKIFTITIVTVLIFALCLEFYNPLSINKNSTVKYYNNQIPELPKMIEINYNNKAYIGEDFSDTITRTKICFVGSSKTQSIYVPYDKQWTTNCFRNTNAYWINNCGKDGAGINQWVKEINNLRTVDPDFIVVLVDPFSTFNKTTKNNDQKILEIFSKIKFVSSVIHPLYRIVKTKFNGNKIGHKKVVWENEKKEFQDDKKRVSIDLVKVYSGLDNMINEIRKINAIPIFISCPTPYGDYTNSNNVAMINIQGSIITDFFYYDFSNILKIYCEKQNINFINGYSLQKNTNYFYDHGHFNIEGSEAFARLINPQIEQIITLSKSNQNHQGSN